jgi:2-polyprenyl-3-methyl-5-hydroxy-6-metoxy-1,4-benzoquinol methylase
VVAQALPIREPVRCPVCGSHPTPFAQDYQGFSLARCGGCALELHSPRPPFDDLTAAVYGEDYFGESDGPAELENFRRQLSRIERLAGGRARILDVGCGAGGFLRLAKTLGWRTYGSDVRIYPEARSCGAQLWEGTLKQIDFGAERFEAIRYNHVLEHTPDPVAELRRAAALLAPGGVVMVSVPNLSGLSARIKSLQSRLGIKRRRWHHYGALHHLWYFRPRTLRAVAQAAGLSVALWETPVWAKAERPHWATRALRWTLEPARAASILDGYLKVA